MLRKGAGIDRTEFACILAYIAAGCRTGVSEETAEVYFDLLGDLDPKLLKAAAKVVLLQHRYPTLPSAAELRQTAIDLTGLGPPPRDEACRQVTSVVHAFSSEARRQAKASLHPDVAHAADTIGWDSLHNSTEPETLRAQFFKVYEDIAARRRRELLLPESLRAIAVGVTSFLPKLPRPAIPQIAATS